MAPVDQVIATVGGQQSLESPVEFAGFSPIVEGLVLTASCEMDIISLTLDDKIQNLGQIQLLLFGSEACEKEDWGSDPHLPIFPDPSQLLTWLSRVGSYSSGPECVFFGSHSFGL